MDASSIEALLTEARIQIDQLEHWANGRIEPRKRFKIKPRPEGVRIPRYVLCLDECGSHVRGIVDSKFPGFCLSGVIVAEDDYEAFDVTWKAWKARNLGSPQVIVHEPEVRGGSGSFARPDSAERIQLQDSLADTLDGLSFTCIAAVVDMREFIAQHPDGRVDDFLPTSCYLMCIDFIMERFVHYLHHVGGGARGFVVAESRGAYEDASVHAEYIRLHLEGTQFVPPATFRTYLRPYIEFFVKKRNHSGLQIADLAARPLADRVLNPQSDPPRWEVFRPKLYDGAKGAPESYGLKVFPLTELNDPFWDQKS